ncbi:MAG: peptidoglycan editing factor PgeF [Anaerolineae bacterium]
MPLLRFRGLGSEGTIRHAFTTRLGGVSSAPFHWLNLSLSVGDDEAAVLENRRLVAKATGMPLDRTAWCRQMSGNTAVIVDGPTAQPPEADALATRTPGVYLRIGLGDCLPIILADASVPAVAIAHAGWRGTVARVAENAWSALRSLGARPDSTVAYIGPGIGACCYEVGQDVVERVHALGTVGDAALESRDGSWHLDLPALNAGLLASHGVRSEFSHCCTACHSGLFFSHRADKGRTGRFCAFVGIAP